ncbi:MAG: hypothetical protein U9P90_00225 [Patescibacteria group bacterium]|nr:hypothetical protein [Patescibacteria group bacterium]
MKILVVDKLKENKLTNTKSVQGIIAVTGPDTFSISRSNVATANTLAFAWNLPVVGISRKEFKNKKELIKIGLRKLKKTKLGKFVLPVYDKKPNIT